MHKEQSSPNRPANDKLQLQKAHLDELLACQICYIKAALPTLCPHCSKLYCEKCITKSLSLKPECPNCRQLIKGQLNNSSRFLDQLTGLILGLI